MLVSIFKCTNRISSLVEEIPALMQCQSELLDSPLTSLILGVISSASKYNPILPSLPGFVSSKSLPNFSHFWPSDVLSSEANQKSEHEIIFCFVPTQVSRTFSRTREPFLKQMSAIYPFGSHGLQNTWPSSGDGLAVGMTANKVSDVPREIAISPFFNLKPATELGLSPESATL
jgi:hypothetical protein